MRKAYWWRAANFGDTLTPIVMAYLGIPVEYSSGNERGRIVGVGSIAHHAKPGDIIFGSGSNRPGRRINGTGIKWLAVRGPLTRSQVVNADVPEIYGDPALLLPRIYTPGSPKKYRRGILPHYVDKPTAPAPRDGEVVIDIQLPWMQVIEAISECEEIVSSSLHGIIAAEAYGIPTEWAVWGKKIVGGEYKFHDYILGTGRPDQGPGKLPPIPDLAKIQNELERAALFL